MGVKMNGGEWLKAGGIFTFGIRLIAKNRTEDGRKSCLNFFWDDPLPQQNVSLWADVKPCIEHALIVEFRIVEVRNQNRELNT